MVQPGNSANGRQHYMRLAFVNQWRRFIHHLLMKGSVQQNVMFP